MLRKETFIFARTKYVKRKLCFKKKENFKAVSPKEVALFFYIVFRQDFFCQEW